MKRQYWVLWMVLGLHGGASAQVPMTPSTLMLNSQIQLNTVSSQIVRNSLLSAGTGRATANRSTDTSTTQLASNQTHSSARNTPALLASHYPQAARPEVERVFRDLLGKYHEVERAMGIPERDFAGAVAMFLSGSYEAYHNTSLEPEQFKAFVTQLQQVIGANPEFARVPGADRQEAYEQMAIIGMFMAGTQDELSRKPNPQIAANMRQAAKGYLEQFLKTDADRVKITAQGLVFR